MARTIIKTMKASDDFIKGMNETVELKNKIGELLGDTEIKKKRIAMNKVENEDEKEAQRKYEIIKLLKASQSLTKRERERLSLLLDMARTGEKFIWLKFRLENFDNEFGDAETLSYSEKEKIIKIVVDY